jgi:23S rRNA (pseudouridine1915-N3)-methyltransferase
MKVRLLCGTKASKAKHSELLSLEAEYLKRLKPYGNVSVEEISVKGVSGGEEQKEKEAQAFLAKLSKQDFVVVLDEHGECISSQKLSDMVQARAGSGLGDVCFLIGGTFGHGRAALERANFVWSISPLTFTAQMARLIAIEQIYRATMIWKGVPYHKE